jgi:hypothetical protein
MLWLFIQVKRNPITAPRSNIALFAWQDTPFYEATREVQDSYGAPDTPDWYVTYSFTTNQGRTHNIESRSNCETTLDELGMYDGVVMNAWTEGDSAEAHYWHNYGPHIGVFAEGRELGDVRAFGAAEDAPGAAWLKSPVFPLKEVDALQASTVAACVSRAAHHHSSDASAAALCPPSLLPAIHTSDAPLLSSEECDALVRRVDDAVAKRDEKQSTLQPPLRCANKLAAAVTAGNCADDFKVVLSVDELTGVLGRGGAHASSDLCDALRALLGGTTPPDVLALRRTVGTSRWVGWHTDTAARTVQVRMWHPVCAVCVCVCMCVGGGRGEAGARDLLGREMDRDARPMQQY